MKLRSAVSLWLILICVLTGCGKTDVEPGKPLLPQSSAKNRPNILLVVSDDLGYMDVGAYGNSVVQTPNIDRLASEGVQFNRAFVPASMCSPSRAALYTGLYPHRNGMSRNHYQAKQGVRSIPHYLTALGYRTALVGKSHVKPFDVFPFERVERKLDDVAQYLDSVGDSPFVMVVAQHHPHLPWLPNKTYDPSEMPLSPKLIDTPETRETMARYYSSINAADAELGAFLKLFDERGLTANTVVIYLSDHGPQFPFAKFSNYEAGLKVPLIVRWPSVINAGRQTQALVSSTDILPTIIELAGGEADLDLDGRSMMSVLIGESDHHHEAVYGTHSTLGLNIKDLKPYGIRSVRTERYRYIRNLHPQNTPRTLMSEPRKLRGSLMYLSQFGVWVPPGLPTYWKSWQALAATDDNAAAAIARYLHRPAEELYDLDNDPHEQYNLADSPEHAATLDQLRERLTQWMRQQNDPELNLVIE